MAMQYVWCDECEHATEVRTTITGDNGNWQIEQSFDCDHIANMWNAIIE